MNERFSMDNNLDNLDIKDVKIIINKLMSFIVLEGKVFVSDKEKSKYVKSYLNLFIKVINEPELEGNNNKALLMEHIYKDISRYID